MRGRSMVWRPRVLAALLVPAPPTRRAQRCPTSSAEQCDDPEERFMRVLQYYLAGWHIKPKGVKKP
jgi:hypothetical protein